MKKWKLILSIVFILSAVAAIYFVLSGKNALLLHPKGIVAKSELQLMKTNVLLMLIVIVPTFLALLFVIRKYRASNKEAKYEPEEAGSGWKEVVLWVIPSIVIAFMTVITWRAAHALDPYVPLQSEKKPLTIQVIAMDWKWLFIYPEQEIATVNFVQFPAMTPIKFELAADESPMNSFWIPQLSGQIYAMTGMITPLHLMADEVGEYAGRAAEINGEGFADMTFVAKATTVADFEDWVTSVKRSPLELTDYFYLDLLKPSQNLPVSVYSFVEKGLFHKVVMKYMHPHG